MGKRPTHLLASLLASTTLILEHHIPFLLPDLHHPSLLLKNYNGRILKSPSSPSAPRHVRCSSDYKSFFDELVGYVASYSRFSHSMPGFSTLLLTFYSIIVAKSSNVLTWVCSNQPFTNFTVLCVLSVIPSTPNLQLTHILASATQTRMFFRASLPSLLFSRTMLVLLAFRRMWLTKNLVPVISSVLPTLSTALSWVGFQLSLFGIWSNTTF